ncbi:hypothetical protein, partial [Nostoc sp. MG11]|uniref:hypothetical protein n=1 Tax=Nostoc sp. MG11 TaxID=2721166 RepID=UPI001D00E596
SISRTSKLFLPTKIFGQPYLISPLAIAWLIPLSRFLALKAVALILHSLELFLVPFQQDYRCQRVRCSSASANDSHSRFQLRLSAVPTANPT